MKLSTELKKDISDNLDFAVRKIREEHDPRRQVFFFSAVTGTLYRVLNIKFDTDLLVLATLAESLYNSLSFRLDQIYSKQDETIQLPGSVFSGLANITERLKTVITEEEEILPILKDLSILAFAATGMGYYLFERDILKLPSRK